MATDNTSPPCPKCRGTACYVTDSRMVPTGHKRRRRHCTTCGTRFTTFEGVESRLTDKEVAAAIKRMDDSITTLEEAATNLQAFRAILVDTLLSEDNPNGH